MELLRWLSPLNFHIDTFIYYYVGWVVLQRL